MLASSEMHQRQARQLIRKLSKEFSKDFVQRRPPEQQQSLKALAGSQMREMTHQLSHELARQLSSEREQLQVIRQQQQLGLLLKGLQTVPEVSPPPSALPSFPPGVTTRSVAKQDWEVAPNEQVWIMKRQLSRELSRQLSREISLELNRRQNEMASEPVKDQLRRAEVEDAERRWREAQSM